MIAPKLLSVFTTSSVLAFSFLLPVSAQVITDGTTSTTVDIDGTINNGDQAGSNLFHSFQEFSVPTGGRAFFNNSVDIVNIFSRVTGGNLSNIDGLLGANGTANLFLINPAGIIFGENARLSIGGSFFGSTADSIVFPDGEFSATDLDNPPLITINAPLGLGIRDDPAEIINRSFVQDVAGNFVGLEVNSGNSLALVGGNINFEGGEATARGGNIELGGLSLAGTVTFNADGTLSFPDNVPRADITLDDFADVDVTGTNGGSININANNFILEVDDFGSANLRAGILANSGFVGAQAGDITINATNAVNVSDGSTIQNLVNIGATGNSGNIVINSGSFSLDNNSSLSSSTFGQGNPGNIDINVTGAVNLSNNGDILSQVNPGAVTEPNFINSIDITADSFSIADEASSISITTFGQGNAGNINLQVQGDINLVGGDIFSQIANTGIGNGGNITLDATNISLIDGSVITSAVFGTGNAGKVTFNASDNIIFSGLDSQGFRSGINNSLVAGGIGNAGDIEVNAQNLTLQDGGLINSSASGAGNPGNIDIIVTNALNLSNNGDILSQVNAGAVTEIDFRNNINITTGSFFLADGTSSIATTTFGQGNAGNINLQAQDDISLVEGSIFSQIANTGLGNGGNITLDATNIDLANGSQITAAVFGTGNAGKVTVNASEDITFSGIDSQGFASGINNNLVSGGIGNAGDIEVNARNLTISDNGLINSSTSGTGNPGNIDIIVTGALNLSNNGDILSQVNAGAVTEVGSRNNINISAGSFSVTDEASSITTTTSGQGNAGNINLQVQDDITLVGSKIFSQVSNTGIGDGGNVTLNATNISLSDGSVITAAVFGTGNAGKVTVNASEDITFSGIDSQGFRSGVNNNLVAGGIGNAGDIEVNARSLTLQDDGLINSSTSGAGNPGNIDINLTNTLTLSNNGDILSQVNAGAVTEVDSRNDINITTGSFSLADETSSIATTTFGQGNAGNINLQAQDDINLVGGSIFSQIANTGIGDGGNITLNATNIASTDGSQITAAVFGTGNAGKVTVNASEDITFSGIDSRGFASGINNNLVGGGIGNAGDIEVNARNLTINDNGVINSSTSGTGNPGNIDINLTDTLSLSNNSDILSQVNAGAVTEVGSRNNINISAGSFAIADETNSISTTTFGQGNAGNINLQVQGDINLIGGDIFSQVGNTGIGDGGNVTLNATNIDLIDGSVVTAAVFGTGNAGKVTVNASEDITFSGIDSQGFRSGVNNSVVAGGIGNAGDIDINARNLTLREDGLINGSTSGQGNTGNIKINATDTVTLSSRSTILSQVNEGAVTETGAVKSIEITADSFSITDETSSISSTTFGQGNAGNINIQVQDNITLIGGDIFSQVENTGFGEGGDITLNSNNISLFDGAQITASLFGTGNAGSVNITAAETITFDGEDSGGFSSGAFSTVESNAIGNAEGIIVNTGSLFLSNGATINTSTSGQGNAGSVNITAAETITFDGENSSSANSGLFSTVNVGAIGDAAGININTDSLNLTNGGTVSAATFGQGNAGNININATDDVTFSGIDSQGFSSGVSSTVSSSAIGNAGNITINSDSIALKNEGIIESDIFGEGSGGDIILNVNDDLSLNNGQISATNQPAAAIANPGNQSGTEIRLQIGRNLILSNNSLISAEATNNANGGNINIDAGFIVGLSSNGLGSDIRANAEVGRGGEIVIDAQGVLGFEENGGTVNLLNNINDIDASSQTTGLDGVVTINNPDVNPLQGVDRLPTNPVSAETIAADACSAVGGETNLIIKGKGGISPDPTEPFPAESLILDGQSITLGQDTPKTSLLGKKIRQEPENTNDIPVYLKPFVTDNGDIYPARGVIVNQDGTITLTAYSAQDQERILQKHANCNS